MFAGAVMHQIKSNFSVNCDSSKIAESLYLEAKENMFEYMKNKQASHYLRLSGFGLDKDLQHCLTPNTANVLPTYVDGKLINIQ
jgi:2-phosphosulfolactate phosphatase